MSAKGAALDALAWDRAGVVADGLVRDRARSIEQAIGRVRDIKVLAHRARAAAP